MNWSKVGNGLRDKVQTGDTVWNVSQLLAAFGQKVTAYDLNKYSLSVDPRLLKPGSLLVVPKRRSEPCKIAPVLS